MTYPGQCGRLKGLFRRNLIKPERITQLQAEQQRAEARAKRIAADLERNARKTQLKLDIERYRRSKLVRKFTKVVQAQCNRKDMLKAMRASNVVSVGRTRMIQTICKAIERADLAVAEATAHLIMMGEPIPRGKY